MLNCKKGMLVLFPSDLDHEVGLNQSQEERIALSFNTFFKGTIGYEEEVSLLELK
jgi:ectoine hydroxylase-related dioxygenase (phytanoyl-CoA dioxygenase family)